MHMHCPLKLLLDCLKFESKDIMKTCMQLMQDLLMKWLIYVVYNPSGLAMQYPIVK